MRKTVFWWCLVWLYVVIPWSDGFRALVNAPRQLRLSSGRVPHSRIRGETSKPRAQNSKSKLPRGHQSSPRGRIRPTKPPQETSAVSSPRSPVDPVPSDAPKPQGKILTRQSILGKNIVTCRHFRVDSTKFFHFLGSYDALAAMPSYSVPEVAFVGRSNVGKSSLLNTISGLHKAIAVESKQPGRTQMMNQFLCGDVEGDICIFTDLPGYGFAKIAKDTQQRISHFVNEYLRERGALKMTCLLVDARREPQAADIQMVEFLNEIGGNYVVIATKVDKLSAHEVDTSMRRLQEAMNLPPEMPVRFSAVTGEGKRQVWHAIKDGLLDQGLYLMDEDDDNRIDGDGDDDGDDSYGDEDEGEEEDYASAR